MAEKSRVTTPRGRHESLVPGVSSSRLRPDSDQSRIWCRARPWLVCYSLNELTWVSFVHVVHWHLTIFFFFFFFFFFVVSWVLFDRPASHRSSRPAQLHIRYRPDLRSLLCPRHISSVLLACQKDSNEEIQLLRGRLAWTSVLPWTCPPWRGDCRHWKCKCSMDQECLGVPISWYHPALHSLSHNHRSQKKQGLDEQHAT